MASGAVWSLRGAVMRKEDALALDKSKTLRPLVLHQWKGEPYKPLTFSTRLGLANRSSIASAKIPHLSGSSPLFTCRPIGGFTKVGRKFESILETVGNTPIVKIGKLAPPEVNRFVKIEALASDAP
jgi:hypothetical protein